MQDLPVPVINSKLYPPPIAQDVIGRERLLSLAQAIAASPVTLVAAPAGYGKSTLASQWLDRLDCRTAWLSLEPADGDLRQFVSYLIAALRNAVAGCCRETAEHLHLPALPSVDHLAAMLSNDLELLSEPVVLVLDDFHQISSPAVNEMIDALLRHPPRYLHLVIVTRRDPPLSLQSLRARGTLIEVRMQQLAFNMEESRDFLAARLGVAISENATSRLHARMEGWPVALRLATLAGPDTSAAEDFVDRIPGDVHAVRAYLLHEVLASQPQSIRAYLLRTAFLERFNASLCEAVLPAGPEGGQTGAGSLPGSEFMDHIRQTGLFAIALDRQSEWFRYHHLFQHMLQDEAVAVIGDDEIRQVHLRASQWCEAHGYLEEALQHLLTGDGPAQAAALMVRHRNTIMNSEQWHRLDSWLQMLPSGLIASRPDLLLLKARLLRTRGSREEMQQALEDAESLLESAHSDSELRSELYGSLEAARCYQLYMESDGPGALQAATRALEMLPQDSAAERGFAMIIRGSALQMTGALGAARHALYAAMSEASGTESARATYTSRVLAALSFVNWMDADLSALMRTAEQSSAVSGPAGLREVGRSFEAAVLYQRNELGVVHDRMQDILGSKAIANAEFHAQCFIISSLTSDALGQAEEASMAAAGLHDLALRTQNLFIIGQSEAFAAELALRQGRLAEALNWAEHYDPEPLAPMYLFFSPPMTLAKVLLHDDSTVSRERARLLLDRLVDYLTRIHNHRFLAEALALRAISHDLAGKEDAAVRDLTRAIGLALPGRFIRLFVDLGTRLVALLSRVNVDDDGLIYVGEILAAFRDGNAQPGAGNVRAIGLDALSKREQQILPMLGDRLSNKEIADRLNISEATVKRHTANIYQKLGVHGRRQAVAKATGLGMLKQAT